MTYTDVVKAVDAGLNVYWSNTRYKVMKDHHGQYLNVCDNGYCTGLQADFYDKPSGFNNDKFFIGEA